MTSGSEALPISDFVAFVRRRPDMFAPSDKTDPYAFATLILKATQILGSTQCGIHTVGAWTFVVSDVDWLPQNLVDVFGQAGRFVEAGENSIRPESVLFAFARGLVVIRGGQSISVSGELPDAALISQLSISNNCTALGFVLKASTKSSEQL